MRPAVAKIVLASGSPRRRELLKRIGITAAAMVALCALCFPLALPARLAAIVAGTLALCFSFRKSLRQARRALESMVRRKKGNLP